MNENKDGNIKKSARTRITGVIAAVAVLVVLASSVTYAWLFMGRNAAAVAEITDPTAIFIRSGNREDVRYIELGGIDIEKSEQNYRDYVFCVQGENVDQYLIQLAFTTNNQFEYEIYPAVLASGAAPAGSFIDIEYTVHVQNEPGDVIGSTQHYYVANASDIKAGHYLNKKTDPELLAETGDVYENSTYGDYVPVNKYAYPLYWHTDTNIPVAELERESFHHYYVLRVKWTEGAKNTKETDIIYISAKSMA